MSNQDRQQAEKVFKALCAWMTKEEWKFQADEEKLVIESGVRGDDLPIKFRMVVNPDLQIISFLSSLPFNFSKEKLVEGALAICLLNYALVDGSFDYDIRDGEVVFRLTSSFRESLVSDEVFSYMINLSAHVVDEYNDKLLMVAKDALSLEKFSEQIRK